LTVQQIAARADSSLTFWRDTARYGRNFANLDSVIAKIELAFDGPLDTITYAEKLVLAGVRPLVDVPFLKPNPGAVPATITPVFTTVLEDIPGAFELYQSYPNPFNPTTTIAFDVPEPARVTLRVYNILGQQVATLLDHEDFEEGNFTVDFNANNLASGVYFYRIEAEIYGADGAGSPGRSYSSVRKMVLLR
jgi:hypothetical protein